MPVVGMNSTRRTAADIMTPNPRTCSPFSTVLEAVLVFRDAACGALPVVDSGKPVGIVTDRHVALALADIPDLPTHPVSEIMSTVVFSVSPDTVLDVVLEKLGDDTNRRVLVVDPKDQLLGIISWADVAKRCADSLIGQMVSHEEGEHT